MEDRVHIECVRRPDDGDIDYIFVAVYDGHGGPEASEFARQFLLANIQGTKCKRGFSFVDWGEGIGMNCESCFLAAQREFQSNHDEDILTAIRQGFIETHQAMWRVFGAWKSFSHFFASLSTNGKVLLFYSNLEPQI
jgi:protein phosphatase 1D